MRNPVALAAKRFGARVAPRLITGAVVFLLVVAATLAAIATSKQDWAMGVRGRLHGAEAPDQDQDGLVDALENRLGSDLDNPATLGKGVADGWLYHWFGESLDWSDPTILDLRVLVPPSIQLPLALQAPGALVPPTVFELYEHERGWRNPSGQTGTWWTVGSLDPHQWDHQADGVADAWLVQHGIDPMKVQLDKPAGDADLTIREKYALGLDPSKSDTDGDGLSDGAELKGVARFGGNSTQFQPTDPKQFSSRKDGIADGYLVRFHLDPGDDAVATLKPGQDGITVREAFDVTQAHCHASSPAGCDWRQRLLDGPLKDPRAWDSVGDGVPDAWSMRDPFGRAPPLEHTAALVAYDTSEWDRTRWTGDPARLQGVIVDAANPAPKSFALTFHDLYTYQRPLDWSEAKDGPWWGGLPTVIDAPSGALPPAVAVRGWTLQVDAALGREPGTEAKPHDLKTVNAAADPRKSDSDGDGLLDIEEYYGIIRGSATVRTNPGDPDTDGDGLTDCQEISHTLRHQCEDPDFRGPHDGGLGTDALRRSTAGGFLTDGQAFDYWSKRAAAAAAGVDPAGLASSKLGPLGDVDGDGQPNILDRDSDGDGLVDGMELFPNRFLPHAMGIVRPSTDPARQDSDGDGLPDAWEVKWSLDGIYDCKAPCKLPPATQVADGWPLHPARTLSLAPLEGLPIPPGLESDAHVNLANDRATGPKGVEEFNNELAYRYDLTPYHQNVPDPLDGIRDMFAIVWGVENVPEFAHNNVTRGKASELANDLAKRNLTLGYTHVVINPRVADAPGAGAITKDSNLLGVFTGREKGTWALVNGNPGMECLLKAPSSGKRAELGVPRDPASPTALLADRSALALQASSGLCWQWVAYPMHKDMLLGTNPWRHDTSGDGLPDAWTNHYGVSAPATARLIVANCDKTPIDGQATINHCLTYATIYERGLDPTLTSGDTDGGGVPDWLEVHMGLRPLDRADDSPEQAWSGNGLPNIVSIRLGLDPLSPDSDGDGLLDGGDLTSVANLHELLGLDDGDDLGEALGFLDAQHGDGNLCLPGPSHPEFATGLVPNMAKRPANVTEPAPGQLNYSQLYSWYVALGILHEPNHLGACPTPQHVLFKREAIKTTATGAVGAGHDSNSLLADTSPDGVPDGWLVHWRDHRGDASLWQALSPGTDTRQEAFWDPDEDLVVTPTEHAGPGIAFDGPRPPWGAPEAWDALRDGTWWGGMDPTAKDSAGSGRWFATPRDDEFYKKSPVLADLDNDGIPDRYDAFPSMDHGNTGIVRAREGRHVTDFGQLWPALATRHTTSFLDKDGDRIPDFIDRARVTIEDLSVPAGTAFTKGAAASVLVNGTLRLAEPVPTDAENYADPTQSNGAANMAPVGNATVKVIVRDSIGQEALAGAAFTDAQGRFSVPLRIDDQIPVTHCPSGAAVAGRLCDSSGTQPSAGLTLRPGTLSVRIEAEANDPARHPITFGGQAGAIAYKSVLPGAPFLAPDGLGPTSGGAMEFIATKETQDAIDETLRHVKHTATAIFPAGTQTFANAFTLRTQTSLTITDARDVMLGDPLVVNGTFLDKIAGVPLPNHSVQLRLGSLAPIGGDPVTAANGAFHAQFSTANLSPGTYNVTAEVAVPAGFLEAPAQATAAPTIERETSWQNVSINGQQLQGSSFRFPAQAPLSISARLVDHSGQAVASKQVSATVTQTTGASMSTVSGPSTWTTLPNGTVLGGVPPIPGGRSLGPLELVLRQSTSSADSGLPLRIVLLPTYATALNLSNVSTDVGRPALVEVQLVRADGPPAFDGGAVFLARPDDKASPPIQINGTDGSGRFRFAVSGAAARSVTWNIQYTPGDPQLMPSNATVSVRHVIATVIDVTAPLAVRDAPIEITGRLVRADGTPTNGNITGVWGGANVVALAHNGTFNLTLAKQATGLHPLTLRFHGSPREHASNASFQIAVREPTALMVHVNNVTASHDGISPSRLVEGNLSTQDGAPIGHRAVLVNFTGPEGRTAQVERPTDVHGAFHVSPGDVAPLGPGNWSVRVQYAGAQLETPANASSPMTVKHVVALQVTRAPADVRPGEPMQVRGIVSATAGGWLKPVTIHVQLGEGPLAETVAIPGQPWQVEFAAPSTSGKQPINATGTSGQWGVHVMPTQVDVTLVKGVQVDLVKGLATGSHELLARDSKTNASVANLRVLVLRSVDGVAVATYEIVTDSSGRGVLQLPGDAAGSLSVLAVTDQVYRLESSKAAVSLVTPPDVPASPWVFAAAMAALAAGVSLAAFFLAWRLKKRNALAAAVAEARRLLLDPRSSPARVIEAVYARLLLILKEAGDPVHDQDTVRDIAVRATHAFSLPQTAMQGLTRLFELAKYARKDLSIADRATAIGALEEIADALGAKVHVQQVAEGVTA